MFFSKWFKKQRKGLIRNSSPSYISSSEKEVRNDLASKVIWFREQLQNCTDIKFHEVRLPGDIPCVFIYIEGITDQKLLQEQVLSPLMFEVTGVTGAELVLKIAGLKQLPVSYVETSLELEAALNSLFEGTIVLLVHNEPQLILFPMKALEKRAIPQAENETVIRGPKEAFVEDISTNITMIRRKIKHPALKLEHYQFGSYTRTAAVICYIEGICEQKLIDEVKKRLSRIDIDGVLGSSYIEEFIEDNPYSPFPQVQYTERPDVVSAALLEGRVAILIDGTPIPLIVPVTLYMLLQSPEDYYQRFVAATWIRWIRYIFLLISFLLPSIYIAVSTFHPEMLPPNLLITVASAREDVPFPAIIEAYIMEITFEALREAGLRIPKPIGQTISIIGALVIGQAVVQAGIVSAPMVIVVSITGIASFIIPHFDLGLTFRLLRFPVMILAASFGLYGVIISILLIYVHLVSLRSFGTPYLSPTAPIVFSDWKDVLIRAPWWMMKKRPLLYGTNDDKRQTYRKRPQIPEDDGD
ncbi:spore germination protein [Paenibacillus radicis (ex Xue et al. 2023)]|uniref:Spore germination protein n=1 Tax=Paenibacillus radicis (ex Xue et al. 2023) TaxID=2972489 RepID=A0ABT1YQY9_9BACL|nr:spore germination protein [Paenibacillus radicis (ex Xue et al. 2023)]MCR8634395.1 spore germination protein [Paenibacillus radicis (ex Xue et al. 2023)]